MIWKKESRTVSKDGTIIGYRYGDTDYCVESRKKHIPHANGSGYWDHTSYFVIVGKEEFSEHFTLSQAKATAERLYKESVLN